MTKIKICGISETAHILETANLDIDFLGLVFAKSPRQISPGKARELVETAHKTTNRSLMVGVFVNHDVKEVNRIADYCPLDWVQLSGDESWEYCLEISKPIIKVIRIPITGIMTDLSDDLEKGYKVVNRKNIIVLLDTMTPNSYGGSGQTFNWQLIENIASEFPLMIAGGLTPDNVSRLIKQIQPWGVDASSGVEINGKKDISRIISFVQAVRGAHVNN
jgi:phosphoribosylanthranilate isomerase